MSVVFFVSGHGLGHAAREAEILRHLPAEIPRIVVTRSPAWFWRERFGDRLTVFPATYDVGCVQTNSLEVDPAATLSAWEARQAQNLARRDHLEDCLRAWKARVVVTDVASFPLTVAADLGLRSVCVANFTWADIYEEYPGFDAAVSTIRSELARADLLLEAGLSLPMPGFAGRISVGMVAASGTARREALERFLPVDARGRRLALIYPGEWGTPFRWDRLARFKDWRFLSLMPPDPLPEGVIAADRSWMAHSDLVASVDLVVSKAGYGIVGECLSAGTPLLYGPRERFAEFAALDAALSGWAGGVRVSAEAFLAADWNAVFDRVAIGPRPVAMPAPGGPKAAQQIARLWQESGSGAAN